MKRGYSKETGLFLGARLYHFWFRQKTQRHGRVCHGWWLKDMAGKGHHVRMNVAALPAMAKVSMHTVMNVRVWKCPPPNKKKGVLHERNGSQRTIPTIAAFILPFAV